MSRPEHTVAPPGAVALSRVNIGRLKITCVKCERRGEYNVQRLAERFGPHASLIHILATLSADCPRRRTAPSPYANTDPCGARYDTKPGDVDN